MIGILAAALAGYGAFLLHTALVFGWEGLGPRTAQRRHPRRASLRTWLDEAGAAGTGTAQFVAASAVTGLLFALIAYVIFGGVLPTLSAAIVGAGSPAATYRSRRLHRRQAAQEAWPRLLEELRLRTGSLGRSIPQALFEVAEQAPEELLPAFRAAAREWLLTTDFEATAVVLRQRLADPTADAVAETLVVAHELGGRDLDRRLTELIEDRTIDLQGRKDAASKQAGVRFARRFVLLVPLGMALAGLAIGTGRSAYDTAPGQLAVAVGIMAVVACWVWSGRLLRLPAEPRVFADVRPVPVVSGDPGA